MYNSPHLLLLTTVRLPCVFIDELRRKNKNSPTHSGTSAAAFSSALVFQLFCVQEANAGHHALNLGGQGYINPNQRLCLGSQLTVCCLAFLLEKMTMLWEINP